MTTAPSISSIAQVEEVTGQALHLRTGAACGLRLHADSEALVTPRSIPSGGFERPAFLHHWRGHV
jgi:hypothetical protein